MSQIYSTLSNGFGSNELDKMVKRLQSTTDPRRRYEYVLWLGKKLPPLPEKSFSDSIKVKGCVSTVYVLGEIVNGKLKWKGYSDALITKGLLSLLIAGLENLTAEEVLAIDDNFIKETGLSATLTPSRSNGFLNILLNMKSQAKSFLKPPKLN